MMNYYIWKWADFLLSFSAVFVGFYDDSIVIANCFIEVFVKVKIKMITAGKMLINFPYYLDPLSWIYWKYMHR